MLFQARQAAAGPTTLRCSINADFSPLGPQSGNPSVSPSQNNILSAPDSGDAGGATPGEGNAAGPKKPRRRGSRGGRGRGRAAGAAAPVDDAAEAPVAPTPPAAKAAPRPRSRAAAPRRKAPAVTAALAKEQAIAPAPAPAQHSIAFTPPPPATVAAPAPSPAPAAEASAAPDPAMIDERAITDERATSEDPANAGQQNFTPGPPRVGMRPAVVRPAPTGRMSFSKGSTRHQFRPTGFRPPRPFPAPGEAPPAPELSPTGQPSAFTPGPPLDDDIDERAEMPPQRGNAQQRPPQQGNRGNQQNPPQQGNAGGNRNNSNNRGGNRRNDPRGNQQPRQQHPQQQPQQPPRQVQPPQPRPDHRNAPPQGRLPQRPQHRPEFHRPPQQPPMAPGRQGEHDLGNENFSDQPLTAAPTNDLVPLPAQPLATGADALTPGTSALHAPTAADAAALAPFAEDIEIDDSLAQLPPRRRELTGRDMLINVVEGEEIRIAVVRRGSLEELYMERSSTESHIGNIYKGRVTNVEPSIQAAFIDFGIGKNGFLHISDVHPQYFPKKMQPRMPQQHQRRNAPPQRPPAPVTSPEQGFQPPSMPQNVSVEAPGVTTETPGHEVMGGSEGAQGDIASLALPTSEVDRAADALAISPSQSVSDHSSEMNGTHTDGAPSTADSRDQADGSSVSARNSEDTEDTDSDSDSDTDEESTPPAAEEPADFGSAYNSDFDDDDEFSGYEGNNNDLDDGHMKPMEKVGRKTPRHERPPIQQCLRRGQEVIVQVTKEGIGTKGPTLTSYISCPGRYLVMMPGMAQLGVSRKIEDLEQRRELKRTLQELNPPKNLGFIIRTAGTDVSKKELQGDLNYLVRMWKVIANRIRTHKAPVELYQESDLVIRTIRDVFNEDIDRIIVDNEQVASRIRDFLSIVDPRAAGIVELYTGTMPLYQKFGVEREIEKINSRRVELANGGSLVIDSTEALVAIDVNSGRYREMRDAELTAFNMNKEALKEVVRQLRLRDLGGVIVIDFIDMREERHKREIEHLLREELRNDRAKTKVLRMSLFCMIELTRQRVRPSLKRSIYQDCPHCHGSALIKTPESVSLDVMRRLAAGTTRLDVARLDVRAYPTVATFLLNRKRKALVDLEDKTSKRITIIPDEKLAGDQIILDPYDARGGLINIVL